MFQTLFDELGIAAAFEPELGRIVLFSGFLVLRQSTRKSHFHTDFSHTNGKAFTLMTPLQDMADLQNCHLLAKLPLVQPLEREPECEPEREAEREAARASQGAEDKHVLMQFRYQLGRAICLGDGFIHATETGDSPRPLAFLCFTFGAASLTAEEWASAEGYISQQGPIYADPTGLLVQSSSFATPAATPPDPQCVGTSAVHNSVRRGLYADAQARALLNADPPAPSAVATLDAVPPDATTLMTRTEPTLVRGGTSGWCGTDPWASPSTLLQNFGPVRCDLAADLSMTMAEYCAYADHTRADSPYHIYEREYVGDSAKLVDSFVPPPWVEEDLLEIAPELTQRKCLPLFMLGGARTGSQLHQDGHATVSWNACCFGTTRWVFLAPDTDIAALRLDECLEGPALWFVDQVPRLRVLAAAGKVEMRECIQRAGDLVLIPHGWHHATVNLETSCALAHTAVIPTLLPQVWPKFFAQAPAFALALQDVLVHARPALAATLPPSPPAAVLRGHRTGGIASEGRLNLHLKWEPVTPGAGAEARDTEARARRAVFVHRSWLEAQIQRRPCIAHVISGSRSAVNRLLLFHEQMLALASAVSDDNTALCLVEAAPSCSVAPTAARDHEMAVLLEQHGLEVLGCVPHEEMLAWARGVGASAMTVLSDHRTPQMAAALSALANCKVAAHATAAHGTALFVAEGVSCEQDDHLLAVPLASCILVSDVNEALVAPLLEGAVDDGEGVEDMASACLRVALLELMLEQQPPDARAAHYSAVCPADYFASHMACWDADSPAARLASHSMSWRRARAWRAEMDRQRLVLAAAGWCVPADVFLWAALVVQSRAVMTEEEGPLLCPALDAANHASVLATARVSVDQEGMVRLQANGALEAGVEVTICYDEEADYLDVFERWGFFDSSSVVHTAEIGVDPRQLLGDDEAAAADQETMQEWRSQLVLAEIQLGCNPQFNSWWIPDVAIQVCPLLAAVRALYVSEDEVQQTGVAIHDVLASKIRREDEACDKLAALVRLHLAGYVVEDEVGFCKQEGEGGRMQARELACKLVAFEKRLLSAQLNLLQVPC